MQQFFAAIFFRIHTRIRKKIHTIFFCLGYKFYYALDHQSYIGILLADPVGFRYHSKVYSTTETNFTFWWSYLYICLQWYFNQYFLIFNSTLSTLSLKIILRFFSQIRYGGDIWIQLLKTFKSSDNEISDIIKCI